MMQRLDPRKARADQASPVTPPIELHGLAEYKSSPLGVPGLFPGRVIEVRNPKAMVGNRVSKPSVRDMLATATQDLTGEKSVPGAWAKFVGPTHVVGIKINPSGAPACCSSPEFEALRASDLQSKVLEQFDVSRIRRAGPGARPSFLWKRKARVRGATQRPSTSTNTPRLYDGKGRSARAVRTDNRPRDIC